MRRKIKLPPRNRYVVTFIKMGDQLARYEIDAFNKGDAKVATIQLYREDGHPRLKIFDKTISIRVAEDA